MKSTKTILAVAIVIAGFAYAVGAGHPQFDSLAHRCCEPTTWEYEFVASPGEFEVVAGKGVFHGVWASPQNTSVVVDVFDGPPADGVKIGQIRTNNAGSGFQATPIFMELDVQFTNGLF